MWAKSLRCKFSSSRSTSWFEPPNQGGGLCAIFEALEAKQPVHYKLPSCVKRAASTIDWPLVLDAARGEIVADRQAGFDLVEAVKALMCRAVCRNGVGTRVGRLRSDWV
jgi:hypothetical protein